MIVLTNSILNVKFVHITQFTIIWFRAVALGLTADEIQNVENYMEELKAKRGNEERVEKERDVLKVKVSVI